MKKTITLAAMLLLSACGQVEPKDIAASVIVCAPNEGLKHITIDGFIKRHAYCNNGARFYNVQRLDVEKELRR